mmetsp:Transcript_8661/g.19314  ORF Transcript_8661/g.19314 Transcript_8661/m.19314 type:complete len:218 (-) Transcript_8661:1866-2519(-)
MLLPSISKVKLVDLRFRVHCQGVDDVEARKETAKHDRWELHCELLTAVVRCRLGTRQVSHPVDKVEADILLAGTASQHCLLQLAQHSGRWPLGLHEPTSVETHFTLSEADSPSLLIIQSSKGGKELRRSVQDICEREVVVENLLARTETLVGFAAHSGAELRILHDVMVSRQAEHSHETAIEGGVQLQAPIFLPHPQDATVLEEIREKLPVEGPVEV